MRDRSFALGALLAIVGMLYIPAGTAGEELPTLRVGVQLYEAVKPAYYGVRSGLFRRYGINVELVPEPSGAAGLAAIVGGSLDVMFSSIMPILQAHTHGIPVQLIAPSQEYRAGTPNVFLLVKVAAPIQGAQDLEGKTLGVTALRDTASLAARAWIDRHGGDTAALSIVEVPNSAMLAAIEQGRVDVGILANPFAEQGVASGSVRVLADPDDAIAAHFVNATWVSTSPTIAANAVAIQRFVRAMHEASAYTNDHPKETIDLIASFTNLDRSAVAKSPRTRDAEYLDAAYLQPVIDTAARYGFIDRPFVASELISPVALKRR